MKKIAIFNLRSGLACNSSSSHSILLLPIGKVKDVSTDEYDSFGWGYFTAADDTSKNNYLVTAVREAINNIVPEELHNEFLSKFFNEDTINTDSYIDHQSVPLIPMNFKGGVNEEFIYDFKEFLERPEVVVVGGNDNDDKKHPLESIADKDFGKDYPKEQSNIDWVARKDKEHNYWVIFNRVNGSKMRFSFVSDKVPLKASAPELVDIKITDFCPYDCDFCYQDSTLEGKHASMNNIRALAKRLGEAQVLEVALGGGETTLHPNFIDILKVFNDEGIVVNFTTKNFNLLRNKNANDIAKYTGAIAFSVENTSDIEKVYSSFLDFEDKDLIDNYNRKPLINLQVVMGTMSINEFKEIIKKGSNFDFNITLLGYKENGRGYSFSAQDYSTWIDTLKDTLSELKKEGSYSKISIDTALAAQYKKELIAAGVSPYTFHTTEGTFSLYVDAVANIMAPSSYIGFEQAKPFDDDWLENYKTMGVEAPSDKPKKKIKLKAK